MIRPAKRLSGGCFRGELPSAIAKTVELALKSGPPSRFGLVFARKWGFPGGSANPVVRGSRLEALFDCSPTAMRRSPQSGWLSSSAGSTPQNFAPMTSEWIPPGDAGVSATIAKMKNLVFGPQGVRSFTVRQTTLQAVRGTERGINEIEAIFDWVKRNIEFRGEYGETLQSPEATINLGAGDCDDQSTLLAAMANSLGMETRFVTVATDESPEDLSHVYVQVKDKRTNSWVALDPTVANAYAGWEPRDVTRMEAYAAIPASGNNGAMLLVGLALGALALV